MNDTQLKALEYLDEGYSIVPVKISYTTGGKKKSSFPKPWKEFTDRRMTEEECVEAFAPEDISIAIVTGKISGITVLDIDKDEKGRHKADIKNLPETKTIQTQSGGYHLYYKYNPDIKTTAGYKLVNGEVDVRNDNGIVFAPSHDKDQRYKVIKNDFIEEAPIHLFSTQLSLKRIQPTTLNDLLSAPKGSRNSTAYSYFLTELQKIEQREEFHLLLGNTKEAIKDQPAKESWSNIEATFHSATKRVDNFRKDMDEKQVKDSTKKAVLGDIRQFYNRVEEHFITDNPDLVIFVQKENVDFYEYKEGVYTLLLKIDIMSRLAQYLKSKGLFTYNKDSNHQEVYRRLKTYVVSMPEKTFREIDRDYINLKNGLYNIKTYELETHRRDVFSINQLPFAFKEDSPTPLFDKHIEMITQSDEGLKRMHQQMFGYVVAPGNPRHKVHLLYGKIARNGKSMHTKLLSKLVGEINVSNLALSQLQGNKPHELIDIENKKLNISDEATTRYVESPVLTSMSAEGVVNLKGLYKPSYPHKVQANFIICGNDLPTFSDSTGMKHRVVVIPFNHQIPESERIIRYEDVIAEKELPGIFNWAIEGHKDIEKNGFFISAESKKDKKEFDRNANSIMSFLEDECEFEPEIYSTAKDLYGTVGKDRTGYNAYCFGEGIKPVSFKRFKAEIRRLNDGGEIPAIEFGITRKVGTKSARVLLGIDTKEHQERVANPDFNFN